MNKGLLFACALWAVGTSAAQAEDLEFTLINKTQVDMTAFHVSHSGTNQWEENLFAGDYLPSGHEVTVTIADGRTTCTYDIRAEFRDGDTVEEYDVDICELGSYTFE